MQSAPSNRGEMSQDSAESALHRSIGDRLTRPTRKDPASRTGKRAYDALSASSVGLELGISVILGLLFGWWLDKQIGTAPWMMLLFLVFGLIAGFRGVMRAVARAEKAAEVDSRG